MTFTLDGSEHRDWPEDWRRFMAIVNKYEASVRGTEDAEEMFDKLAVIINASAERCLRKIQQREATQ